MTGDVPLAGGNSALVVRRGDRVHRTSGPWTPTVHAYLRHVRAAGVTEVPEPFGLDEEGREVLSFIPGEVPVYPLTGAVLSDAVLVDAGGLLRRLHDAARDFAPEGAVWQQGARTPAETVCVNDFGPHNFVLRGGRLAGVIDLDQAAPGPRGYDLAHLAYRLVPLTIEGPAPDARRRRLDMLADAYGASGRDEVLDRLPEVLRALMEHAGRTLEHRGPLPEHVRVYRDDLAWFDAYREVLAGA